MGKSRLPAQRENPRIVTVISPIHKISAYKKEKPQHPRFAHVPYLREQCCKKWFVATKTMVFFGQTLLVREGQPLP